MKTDYIRRGMYLYGLDEQYKIRGYAYLKQNIKIRDIIDEAIYLRGNYPDIQYVFVIDNSQDLYECYRDSMKNPSVENRVVFKVLLEQNGIQVI